MKTTIVLAHPWHGSFNKAIVDTIVEELDNRKKPYQIIDLNKDGFNPTLLESDLALYSKGQTNDPMVREYQTHLSESNELVFVFPIWWYGMPAILKGFFDKVMLKNFAYEETSTGLKGLLKHIKRTSLLTTSEAPTWYVKFMAGNPIKGTLIHRSLKGMGLKNVVWINSDMTTTGKDSRRRAYLARVRKRFSK